MSQAINLTINGARRNMPIDDNRVTLLDLLRERLDLTVPAPSSSMGGGSMPALPWP